MRNVPYVLAVLAAALSTAALTSSHDLSAGQTAGLVYGLTVVMTGLSAVFVKARPSAAKTIGQ